MVKYTVRVGKVGWFPHYLRLRFLRNVKLRKHIVLLFCCNYISDLSIGKTHVGLKIAKALLTNQGLWSARQEAAPMLVVCYTNHALDQFLEGKQAPLPPQPMWPTDPSYWSQFVPRPGPTSLSHLALPTWKRSRRNRLRA